MPRGGRRPGAGAPRGNTNGLKHGFYSRRVQVAALMLAAVPELRVLFNLLAGPDGDHHLSYRRALAQAARIVIADPALARSIRDLVNQRLQSALTQIQQDPPDPENF